MMERESYWDERYREYWERRTTGETLSGEQCPPPDLGVVQHYLAELELEPGHKVLDVGVGAGRLIPVLVAGGANVYGVDISAAMVRISKERWGSVVRELLEAEAETLPYPDLTFDRVVCWAVFDACSQGPALAEMARVLAVGGRLLVSGKNADYLDDDDEAYMAELGARAKGHPNHFTALPAFFELASVLGLVEVRTHYFTRRGDLARNRYRTERPERFYEFVTVFRKTKHGIVSKPPSIASDVSETFRRRIPEAKPRR